MKFNVNLSVTDRYCNACKGKLWNESDNAVTQAAAKAMFGITPNNCVNGEGGVVHCPYAKAKEKAEAEAREKAEAEKEAAKKKE